MLHLAEDLHVYRLRVFLSFLSRGVPISGFIERGSQSSISISPTSSDGYLRNDGRRMSPQIIHFEGELVEAPGNFPLVRPDRERFRCLRLGIHFLVLNTKTKIVQLVG
jgi:hypothetical protein